MNTGTPWWIKAAGHMQIIRNLGWKGVVMAVGNSVWGVGAVVLIVLSQADNDNDQARR